MKVCIRTADRPTLLLRLLTSIARYEPWMLELQVEVNDGSHELESVMSNRDVAEKARGELGFKDLTSVSAFGLEQATRAALLYQCTSADLRNGYNLWQIMDRHEGQEIILLDDDWVFPLRKPNPAVVEPKQDRKAWECDQYRFNHDYYVHHTDRNDILRDVIDFKGHGSNTVQLCTYGHGVCDDYYWIQHATCVGDHESCTQIEYANVADRLISSGFLTPVYINSVPHVPCLPPDSPNDDTIMLMMSDFGMCRWSNWQIGHFRSEPKSFSVSCTTDTEIVSSVRAFYSDHRSISKEQMQKVIDLLADCKQAEPRCSKHLLTFINNFVLKGKK